jgi:hypothetical protein
MFIIIIVSFITQLVMARMKASSGVHLGAGKTIPVSLLTLFICEGGILPASVGRLMGDFELLNIKCTLILDFIF